MTGPFAEADALHARVRRVIAACAFPRGPAHAGRESFEGLARALAEHQARGCPGYGRLCTARGVDASRDPLERLPAVPTDAFRLSRVSTFPEGAEAAVFRTSGTTEATRGAHAMRTLETYRAAALAWARRTLLAPYEAQGVRARVIAVAPTPEQAPDSSLARMLGWLVDEGAPGSCFASPDEPEAAARALHEAAREGRPVVALATAFAWVHLIDTLAGRSIALPDGSRAMQTGGFKGRSREVSPEELRAAIARALDLPGRAVVGEYGMTELTSQLWAIPAGDDPSWRYLPPPWLRVHACDPATLTALPVGREGIARIEDLGNVESAWAVQTADRVIVHEDGAVTVLGRTPGAPPRGCSLSLEDLLLGS